MATSNSRASTSAFVVGTTGSVIYTSTYNNDVSRRSADQPVGRLTFMSSVELRVFKTFVENYRTTRELRREDAIALDFMFGNTIQQVFELVQEDHVTVRKSPVSNRVLIEVCGKSGDTYWIPPGHSLCQCMSYIHGKKDYCKHVLAAHLYLAITPKEGYKMISDEDIKKVYKEYIEEPLGLSK